MLANKIKARGNRASFVNRQSWRRDADGSQRFGPLSGESRRLTTYKVRLNELCLLLFHRHHDFASTSALSNRFPLAGDLDGRSDLSFIRDALEHKLLPRSFNSNDPIITVFTELARDRYVRRIQHITGTLQRRLQRRE